LQLDGVAVRVDVVERHRHPVVQAAVRQHVPGGEAHEGVEQVVHRRELIGGVMPSRVLQLLGIILPLWVGQQREAVIRAVVGHPGVDRELVADLPSRRRASTS
jgi:hypothetical protein